MRDKIGGRPFEVQRQGDKWVITFYPMSDSARNPDAVLFRLTVSKADMKKLASLCS